MNIEEGTYKLLALIIDPESLENPNRGMRHNCLVCKSSYICPTLFFTLHIRPFGFSEDQIMQRHACSNCIDKAMKNAATILLETYTYKRTGNVS